MPNVIPVGIFRVPLFARQVFENVPSRASLALRIGIGGKEKLLDRIWLLRMFNTHPTPV